MKKLLSLAIAAITASSAAICPSSVATADDTGNYLLSCTFEGSEDGWSGRGSASVEASSQFSLNGGGSLYCSGREESWNGASISLGSSFKAGSSYSFSVNVMYDSGKDTDQYHFTMQYNDANGDPQYVKIASAELLKGKWAQLANRSFTIPADASDISIYIETGKSTSDFYVDDVVIAENNVAVEGAAGGKYIPGDICSDGVIDSFDIICGRRLITSALNDSAMLKNADVDKSTDYSINDLLLLQQYVTGKITEFPDNTPEPVVTPFEYEENLQYKAAPEEYFKQCDQQGTVTLENYNGIRGNKSLYVYTPYNYDPEKQYNIFYLMHGGGENEKTLFFHDDTMIQNMLDHMIMNGELEPLIVVTPTFNGTGSEAGNFYEELRASVIPFVEGKYSTYAESTSEADIKASRMHRAYGGFSMGAVSTWAVFQNNLDIVGYFMPLSGDHWQGDGGYGKAKSLADAVDKSGLKQNQYFIFAATGTNDMAYPNVNPQIDEMKKMSQFVYTSDFSKGNFYFLLAQGNDHWWKHVRHYIYDGLPYFFHETGE